MKDGLAQQTQLAVLDTAEKINVYRSNKGNPRSYQQNWPWGP